MGKGATFFFLDFIKVFFFFFFFFNNMTAFCFSL